MKDARNEEFSWNMKTKWTLEFSIRRRQLNEERVIESLILTEHIEVIYQRSLCENAESCVKSSVKKEKKDVSST